MNEPEQEDDHDMVLNIPLTKQQAKIIERKRQERRWRIEDIAVERSISKEVWES